MSYIDALDVKSNPAEWVAYSSWVRHLVSNGKTVLSVAHIFDGIYEIGLWRSSSENPERNKIVGLYAAVGADDLDEYLANVEPLPRDYRPDCLEV